jgi:YD repeat-containing protein
MPRFGMYYSGNLSEQAFGELIADTLPGMKIEKQSYNEEGNAPGVTHDLFLYYYISEVKDKYNSTMHHIGTYRREDSECWIFDHVFQHPGLEHLA